MNNRVQTASIPPRAASRNVKKRKKRGGFFRFIKYAALFSFIGIFIFIAWFYSPWGKSFRYTVADTLITTQHRIWAKYIIGEDELNKRVAEYWANFDKMGEEKDNHIINTAAQPDKSKEPIEIEKVSGDGFQGYLMTVHDPKSIRVAVPNKVGRGEKVASMVKRTGALAGVNAGGFADPNWQGNGFQPIGLVISGGEVYYDGVGSKATQIVGIDKDGKMIAGKYKLSELKKMNISEAVTFQPRLIVNGKGLIKSRAEGWGIAPRTAMGQTEDGSILFLVIDGRQPAYSIGATLYEVQNILLEHGAVIAANLDGGSSTVLVKDNEVVNTPTNNNGGRYLPTAFLVFDHGAQDVNIKNIWKGLRPKDIDPGKW